jgi:hypothetical protein
MAGKVWTAQEEAELKTLIEAYSNVDEIAAKLKRTPKAVIIKSQRLGLRATSHIGMISEKPRNYFSPFLGPINRYLCIINRSSNVRQYRFR